MSNPEDVLSPPVSVIAEGYLCLARDAQRGITPVNSGSFQANLSTLTELSLAHRPVRPLPGRQADDLYARAVEQLRHGLIHQSLASALQGLGRAPFRLDLLGLLGRIIVELGGHESARHLFERIVAVDPDNDHACLGLDEALDTAAVSELLATI